jgi:hypothetical protein
MDQALAVARLAGGEQIEGVALPDNRRVVNVRNIAGERRERCLRRRAGLRRRRRCPGEQRREQEDEAGDADGLLSPCGQSNE